MVMKRLFGVSALVFAAFFAAGSVWAKDDVKEEVRFIVSMSCENCKKRIEEAVSFEKGVRGLDVDLSKKSVRVVYNPAKTSVDRLRGVIAKLGYTVAVDKRVVSEVVDSVR